jgi:hypothetical protein
MTEFGSDADIFDPGPCHAGKNVEWSKAGLGKFKRGATSRAIRKYGCYFQQKEKQMNHQLNQIALLDH